ncbi:hypothetical protein CYY_000329 [Polysphondylium violaceum]|uniref:Uncharacterized protein n=1 Tax=Polysphondylium violaceum TaxID=133409 RepID=A0A8J4V2H9_9MYCE|nr:hypothetical protein CYY_000329 [Polysphondylium violaceum]
MFKLSVLLFVIYIGCCVSSFTYRKDDVYTFRKDTTRGVFPFVGGYHVKVAGGGKDVKNDEYYVANYEFDHFIEQEQIDQYLFKGRIVRYLAVKYDTFEITDAYRLMPNTDQNNNNNDNTLYFITNNNLVTEYYNVNREHAVKNITEPYSKQITSLHMDWFLKQLYFNLVYGKFENDYFLVQKLYIRVDVNCGRNVGQWCPENKIPTYRYDDNQCVRNTGCVKPLPINCQKPNNVVCKQGFTKTGFPSHPNGCQIDYCFPSFLFTNQTAPSSFTPTQPTREEWARMRQQFQNNRRYY